VCLCVCLCVCFYGHPPTHSPTQARENAQALEARLSSPVVVQVRGVEGEGGEVGDGNTCADTGGEVGGKGGAGDTCRLLVGDSSTLRLREGAP